MLGLSNPALSVPRTRGGDPRDLLPELANRHCSPHARG